MNRLYFVAILLPKPLDEKLHQFKMQLHERYGCQVGLKSPAHITLLPPFRINVEWEQTLIHQLETLSSQVQSFFISTDNFSAFGSRTLFVAVQHNKALNALKRTTDEQFVGWNSIKKESRPFHPHITLATRDWQPSDFAECWPEFANRIFQEQFEAMGLSLLRYNSRTWEVVLTAPFKGTSV